MNEERALMLFPTVRDGTTIKEFLQQTNLNRVIGTEYMKFYQRKKLITKRKKIISLTEKGRKVSRAIRRLEAELNKEDD